MQASPTQSSAQLRFDFTTRVRPQPAMPLEQDEALFAAAILRLRGGRPRSIRWVPHMFEFTPMGLLGEGFQEAGRKHNDPGLESADLLLMGYRIH